MFMKRPSLIRPRLAGGFSLVELMVAMVIGLIVIGAVLALVLSMVRANNQTVGATRLTQELRATAGLMASDLKRAGGVTDPLTAATSNGGDPDTTFAAINTATAGCIRYAYAAAEGGSFHAISLQSGAVFMDGGATAADATCTGGTRLSSPQVSITELTFNRTGRRIDITLKGTLVGNADRAVINVISRAFTQTVFVRST